MRKIVLIVGFAAVIAGCSYQSQRHILKEDTVGNVKVFDASPAAIYQAFVRTALMKNFIVKEEDAQAGSILVERPVEKGKRTYIVCLQARVFEDAPGKSSLFLNGNERCERTYVRDNTRFFLFIIPLPGGGGKEATTVVESEKPIRDEFFYKEFFAMVSSNLVLTEPAVISAPIEEADAAAAPAPVKAIIQDAPVEEVSEK